MTTPESNHYTPEPSVDETSKESSPSSKASSFFSSLSPTCKGALIGGVAGSILPVFGTISGAIIGGIAGKVYEKKCLNKT